MWARSTLVWGFLTTALAVGLASTAVAEMMTGLFPEGVPGYGTEDGVTVQTRLHPELMPLGLHAGDFLFLPRLDEGFGYTSNVMPGSNGRGSWQVMTNPALAVSSDWSRSAFGALVSLRNTHYLSLPSQSRTDATISAGGRIDIGADNLTLAASHLAQHEDRGQIDSLASDRPIAFQLDDARASYTITEGRWSLTPSLDAAKWTYSDTTILGVPTRQAYRDRMVITTGLTTRYAFAPLRSLVLVMRAIDQNYTRTPNGQPSPDSTSYQVLTGVDYDDNAIWRWRMLIGGETRQFASPLYPRQNTVTAEAGVGWSPTGLTTINATISRGSEDAAREGVSGLINSSARVTIDHEYLRNVLFKASVGVQRADFFQGGQQTGTTAGVGVTWVMNRSARLSFTYDRTDLHGSESSAGDLATGYSRDIGMITFRLGL